MVPHRVAHEARVDGGEPGSRRERQLAVEGRVPTERGLGDFAEDGAAARLCCSSSARHSAARHDPLIAPPLDPPAPDELGPRRPRRPCPRDRSGRRCARGRRCRGTWMLVIRNSATRTSSSPRQQRAQLAARSRRGRARAPAASSSRAATSSAPRDTAVVSSGWIRPPLKSAVRSGVASSCAARAQQPRRAPRAAQSSSAASFSSGKPSLPAATCCRIGSRARPAAAAARGSGRPSGAPPSPR